MDRARLVLLFVGTLSWADLVFARAQGDPATPIPRITYRSRRSPGFTSRDLFGNFIGDFDFSPLSHVPYSSYLGEMAPFWSFPANGKFKLMDYNTEPRRRARAAFQLAWERLGRGMHTAQDRLDTVSSDVSETEEDPEPPMRPEEFISEHEKPRDVPTRPNYEVPGGWAKGKIPKKKVDIGFVPLQIYSQTRRYDVEEHLPRRKAVEDAETDEERIAAPRLREVLKNSKLQEVYEEEGYEDLGYDHGGYNHHGEKVEDAVINEGKTVFKTSPKNDLEADSDRGEAGVIKVFSRIPTVQSEDELSRGPLAGRGIQSDGPAVPLNSDVPTIFQRIVVDSGKVSELGNKLGANVKQNLTIYIPEDRVDFAQRRTGSSLESRIVNNPSPKIAFPGKSSRRLYTSWNAPDVVSLDGNFKESTALPKPKVINIHHVASYVPTPLTFDNPTITPVQFSSSTPLQFASTINTYASLINQNISSPLLTNPVIDYTEYDSIQPSYSTTDDYTWAQSSIHEKTVPTGTPIKFEGVTNSDATTTKSTVPVELQISTEYPRRPSSGHRGRRRGSNRTPATQNSSTESETTVPISEDSSTSPTRSNRKINSNPTRGHKMYSNFTRGSVKYNPEDDSQWTPAVGTPNIRHPSLPFDNGEHKEVNSEVKTEKEQEVAQHVLNTTTPGKEELTMSRDSAANAKYVEQLTLAHFSVPANLSPHKSHPSEQDERLKELAKHLNSPETFKMTTQSRRKRAVFYDTNKYPYYAAPPSISKDSAMKYATNPIEVPKKTYGGMEFYESRDSIQCTGPPQPKGITPKREEDGEWNGEPVNNEPRVKGVGNAIDCFKRKFFGKDPLDNPFFKEDTVQSFEGVRDSETFEKSLPLKTSTRDSGQRRIMVFGHHPSPNLTTEIKIAEPVLKTTLSHSTNRPYVGVSFTTPLPISSFNELYQVYEANQEELVNKPPYTYKQYYGLHPGKSQYLAQLKKPHKYTPHSLSAYSIINNRIPTVSHLVPPPKGNMKLLTNVGAKDVYGGYGSGVYRTSIPPIYLVHPTDYLENKIIIRKRETDNSFWNFINPLKWWWPSLFDGRRHEPRYKRSSGDVSYDSVMPSSDEIYDTGREMIEMMTSEKPTTNQPITLSEFKAKFNITEPNKKTTAARLTGGFLNRNADITDVMEMLVGMGPSDSSERSTIASSTKKPKVVFPRVKLPKRKAYPPSKRPGIIPEFTTSEATTTTTTTTLPPPTTTRMYKPKRLIKKNYGKGPFDAFTVLRTQQEVKATKQTFESTEASDGGSRQEGEPRTLSTEVSGENDTLTYMVNPATGVGSWSEQRKWKPKRKRPNRPSVYSYHKSKNMSTRKKQRDIPDPHQKVYVYGLMSKLLNPRLPVEGSSTESSEDLISKDRIQQEYSKDIRSTSVKPPPKFILEPDKRRYYYAKVR